MKGTAMTEFLIDAPHDPFALLVLAHGAGAPMDSGFMAAMAARLAARGVAVARFEFPYMARRRAEGSKRPPDRMPVLLPAFSAAAQEAQARFPGLPLAIGGKSMGGRAAAMAAPEISPKAVVCLGYPFHAAGKAETPPERLAPLLAPPCPALLIQGERDALGSAADVAALTLPPAVRIVWIADGDHSLKPRKSAEITAEEALDAAAQAAATFLSEATR
ncbi:MAG: alpha/beta family hydrolase [Rhodospirillaceae bacterium]